MNHASLILLLLISISFFAEDNSLVCGGRLIENCKECGKGSNNDTCAVCENNYFPLLHNLFCFACDDPFYGQEGCKGQCAYKLDTINLFYNNCPDCKEGYYNKNGACIKCDLNITGCSECSYSSQKKELKCLKCSTEEGYRLNTYSRCVKCDDLLSNCEKCHFVGNNGTEAECDQCINGTYLDSEKKCTTCYDITNKPLHCYKCADENYLKSENCYCDSGYVLNDLSCLRCPDNCDKCELNKATNKTECLRCNAKYYLNSAKQCTRCSQSRCRYCDLDENNNEICLDCDDYKYIPEDKKCLSLSYCYDYEYDNISKTAVCIECSSTNYILDQETHQCKHYTELDNKYKNCGKSEYNSSLKSVVCTTCFTSTINGYVWHNYTYINNTFECLSNTEGEVYGCEFAIYNNESNRYECLQCKNYSRESFIKVNADKSCVETSVANLSLNCLEAEKIVDQYSCIKCDVNDTIVIDSSTNIKDCYKREESLSLCLEGKLEDGNLICTKCVENAILIGNKCSCNSDSFSKDNITSCFKCNDLKEGNPVCNESAGCEYSLINKKITCNKIRVGYYERYNGQYSLCSSSVANCGKCHYNNKVICDECINSVYFLNATENKCILNECDEYPEISPGCIICKDKLKDYKDKKKCQRCKYGYFKTKDEKCVYCSSEKYGGIGCHECGYEGNDIVCKGCYSDYNLGKTYSKDYYFYIPIINDTKSHLLSNIGKCYDCNIQFAGTCKECQLANDTGIETLKCISCIDGYYLTPEGNCVNIMGLTPKIDNCEEYMFSSSDIKFKLTIDKKNNFNIKAYAYSNYEIISEIIYSKRIGVFNKKCLDCKDGYFLTDEGNCEEEEGYSKCTFNSFKNNYPELIKKCGTFCNSDKVIIRILLTEKDKNQKTYYIYNLDYSSYIKISDYLKDSDDISFCMSRSGEGGKYSPENLKYCAYAYYYPENKTYSCTSCYYPYSLDTLTNTCKRGSSSQCTIINKGTETRPKYACSSYYSDEYILITYETGEKKFEKKVYNYGLNGCVEAIANTTYYDTKYNCTKCSFKYIPYYSDYYERYICQYLENNIVKEKNEYYYSSNRIKTKNGVCDKGNYFKSEGEYCYKCGDIMPGCKSSCIYSNKSENALRCTSGCKTGYIEYSEGVCEKCSNANTGCYQCHYENSYPSNYKGIKRKRRFVCDYCAEGYTQTLSGECSENTNLGLDNCIRGKPDLDNGDNYICTQCDENYFVNEDGKCETCDNTHFEGINKKKCIECANTAEGGIANCVYCESNGEKAICLQCLPGYISSETDNACLIIANNKELENFTNCDVLTKENGKYVCSKCKYQYTLVAKNNIKECIYARTLYDINIQSQYGTHYNMTNQGVEYYKDYKNFMNNDYIYNRYSNYLPCEEAENLGTDDNPLYSCIKCSEVLTTDSSYKPPIKVTDENLKISFCISRSYISDYSNYRYCLEATLQIKNGKEVIDCTKCINKYGIALSSNGNYCKESLSSYRCLVPYCKTCKLHDGNTCEECISDYEVNTLTGSCIKKSTEIPSITWKEIYNLNKKNNLSIKLKGITTSQINEGHSFLVILTFTKNQRLRYLEGEKDTIKINAICETEEEVDKYNNEEQLVEYTCTGNNTDNINLTDYKLELIEDGENQKFLMPSNLKELANEYKEKNGDLENIYSFSSFTLDSLRIVHFTLSEDKDFQAENYKFKFIIEGVLDNALINNEPFFCTLELNEVYDKVDCEFSSESNLKAYLTCDFNAEDYKYIKTFSFKTSQISNEENDIIIYNLYKISLINTENKNKMTIKSSSNYAIFLIIGGCLGGAIFIGILIFCYIRRRRRRNMYNNIPESGMGNINMVGMPNMVNMVNMPNAYNMRNMVNMPNGYNMRNIPNMPNTFNMTNMSNMTNVPNMANMHNMPNMANMVNMANMPDAPNASNIQGNNMFEDPTSKSPTKQMGQINVPKKFHDKRRRSKK